MKKIISFVLVCILSLTTLLCCPLNAGAASGDPITLISDQSGQLEANETAKFPFKLTEDAKIKISFVGYRTYGSVIVRIKDRNTEKYVFRKEMKIGYDDTVLTVSLPKGSYKLFFIENGNYHFSYNFSVTSTVTKYTSVSINKSKVSLAAGKTVTLTEKHEPNADRTAKWTSSNKKVATVDQNGVVTAKALGKTKITATVGNKSDTCMVYVVSADKTVDLQVGDKVSVKNKFATVTSYKTAKYYSSDKKIATVSSSGVVTGKARGYATIIAKINGVKYKQPVYVSLPPLYIENAPAAMSVGQTITLEKEFRNSYDYALGHWSSSNTKVAEIEEITGDLTAKALGKAKITIKAGDYSFSSVITVATNNHPVKVVLDNKASVKSCFANIAGYKDAKYSSSNKKIATVNSSGVVTGKALGTAYITAKIKGVSYKQKITVTKPFIILNKTKATIYKGDIAAVVNSYVNLKATTGPANVTVIWTSSNTSVARVSDSGTVTAVGPGIATIKASFTYKGTTYSQSCEVTVKARKAVAASVTSVRDTDIYNDCYINFYNNTNKTITYVTLNIAQYDNRGYRLSSPYEYYYVNESIAPDSVYNCYFWVNDNAKSASVWITKVWFSDGTTYTP